MSLLWRERVHIDLSPRQVQMLRFARGVKRAVKDGKVVTCLEATAGGSVWLPAIATLRELLTHPNLPKAGTTVILSNHFVRYLLVPWTVSLVTEEDQLAFARMRFAQIYGESAQSWMLRLSGGAAGSARIAAAVERPLIDSLTALLHNSPLALRSIQPQLMSAFNSARNEIGHDAWLAVAEPGRLLLGLLRGGRWLSLRSRPLNGETVALAQVLEQERLMLALEPGGEKVYLRTLAGAVLDCGGLHVERLPGGDGGLAAAVT